MPTKRLVAFFDLLGFKNTIRSTPLDRVVSQFDGVFEAVRSAAVSHRARLGDRLRDLAHRFGPLGLRPSPRARVEQFRAGTGLGAFVMSDSIVIYSEPIDEPEDGFNKRLAEFLLVCRSFMARLAEADLPARGAVAFGEMHADPDNDIYLGEALVDAYELSESQEWAGVAVSPALTAAIQRALEDKAISLRRSEHITRYQVPFKSGRCEHWVLNWATEWRQAHPLDQDPFSHRRTGDPRIDSKYENTVTFVRSVTNELPQSV